MTTSAIRPEAETLLDISALGISFKGQDGRPLPIVNGVSFQVGKGETLAIVGESGCGKSVTAMSILRLLPNEAMVAGKIDFAGRNVLELDAAALSDLRGNDISMIFQEPMTSLNPVLTIERQIVEVLRLHRRLSKSAARARAVELLRSVGISAPERRLGEYPHQLSGGMQQRVMIAIAIACQPKLLIADEPTTALDVTIQAQIMGILSALKAQLGMSLILITHDLGVVAENADRVVVMYAGRKVEEASVEQLFSMPLHPYTHGLMRAVPVLGASATGARARLNEIPGLVPPPGTEIIGCVFAQRCPKAQDLCHKSAPVFETKAPGHGAACHFSDKGGSA